MSARASLSTRVVRAWSLASVALLLAGCTQVGDAAPPPTSPGPESARPSAKGSITQSYVAVLDWRHATIELPLDHYGMSLREQQLVSVAASIIFARCVNSGDDVPTAAKTRARRYLNSEPDATHWLFGYWDAKYLADRGLDVNSVHEPQLVPADQATSSQCASEPEYVEMESISADVQPRTGVSDGIMRWSAEAYQKTVSDGRFTRLVEQVNDCIVTAGLTPDRSSPLGGVAVEDGWEARKVLASLTAEATCRDQIDFVQHASDIAAAYQTPLVQENLSELNGLRTTSTIRVAKAVAVLRQVGLI